MTNYPKNPFEVAGLLNEGELPDPSKMGIAEIYAYARNIIHGRWREGEPYLIAGDESGVTSFYYANEVVKGRWPEAESHIAKSPFWAYKYAKHVLKRRWPEAEPTIMKNLEIAVDYAKNVIKGRWLGAEPSIMKDPFWPFYYAKYVIKGRWPEYEAYMIDKDPNPMDDFEDVSGNNRWPDYQREFMK